MINKKDLFSISLKREIVTLDQSELLIQELTTSQREEFELLAMDLNNSKAKNMKSKLISVSVINEDGSRFFGDDEVEKIAMLPGSITEKIFNAVLKINGMGENILEETEGN